MADSFFAGSKKQPQTLKIVQHQKQIKDDFLTPPNNRERDQESFRRNIRVNKAPVRVAPNHHHQQPQHPPRNISPNEVRSPQLQTGFIPVNQSQQQNNPNKPAEVHQQQQQAFPPHTAKPVDDHVTEASTQYETYSQHPQIIYAPQRPQYGPNLFNPNQQQQQNHQQQQYQQQEFYQQHQPSPPPSPPHYGQFNNNPLGYYQQQEQHQSQIQIPETTHYGEHPQQRQQQQIIYQHQQEYSHPNNQIHDESSNFQPNYGY